MDRFGVPIGDRVLKRGIETSVGQGGYCDACGITMTEGPDACLGYIPGVSHACCGHGGAAEPYVVIGGIPDEPVDESRMTTLRGADALDCFQSSSRLGR